MNIKELNRKAESRLRQICGKPSPTKRLVMVLVVCVVFAAANIYFVVSSIYAIGKSNAKKEFLQIEHIESIKAPTNNKDSINFLNQIINEYK